jgi:tetratricopeptide (TPR) repeat protein
MDQETKKIYTEALGLCEKGKIKKAIEKLQLVVRAYPDYPDVHNALGLAFSLSGNNEGAVNSFKRAIELNPEYIEAYIHMAIIQNEQCRFEEAKQSFEQAAKLETKEKGLSPQLKVKLANTYSQLGDTYYELQEYKKAKDEYKRAIEVSSSFLDIKLKLAKTHLQLAEYGDAENLLQGILQNNQGYLEAKTTLGLCYYQQKRFNDAQREWQETLDRDSTDIKAKSYLNMLKEKVR